MARRKKEPRSVHREKIASVLFMDKGIVATSMDDIAKAAGYSKATLYVYFENKEEIVGILVLDSMKKLYHYIVSALEQQDTTKEQYNFICRGLVQYEEKETYQIGEEINEKIKEFLISGIDKGDLRGNLKIMPTIFNLWGMLSGLIQFAANKEEYIKKTMGLSKIQFLEHGFYMLYCSIAVDKEE